MTSPATAPPAIAAELPDSAEELPDSEADSVKSVIYYGELCITML